MASIKDRIKDAQEKNLGDQLTAKQWEPQEGDVLMGELLHREVITRKEDNKVYDKVILKADEGLFSTIIKQGTLQLSTPPVVKGDILVLTYHGMKPIGDGKRSMHDTSVEIYHTGEQEVAPF